MNALLIVLGVFAAVMGVKGTFSEDDQSYLKSKRGLSVVPAPSLAPAAQAYYPAAALSPYLGVAKAAYLPYSPVAPSLLPRPATTYYAGVPGYAAAAPVVPGYSAPAPAVPGYSAPAPVAPAYPAPMPGYSLPSYPAPASGLSAAYASAPISALARAPHLAYSYYG